MKKRSSLIEKIYEKDPASGAFIIEVALDRYSDIFNDWDPAPFRKRDLDRDLETYLEDCSSDIPLKHSIVLQFKIPNAIRDPDKEQRIILGLRTYFSFLMYSLKKDIQESYKKNLLYLITSILLLLSASFLSSLGYSYLLYNTLIEGLFIGGWVFLWEVISSFFIKHQSIRKKYHQYQRLFQVPIQFNYTAS